MHRRSLILGVLFWALGLSAAAPDTTVTDPITSLVSKAHRYLAHPETFTPIEVVRLKGQFEKWADKREELSRFLDAAYGPNLLYLDRFREDLAYIYAGLEDPQRREDFQVRLRGIGFAPFIATLGELTIPAQQTAAIDRLQSTTEATLAAEDRFLQSSRRWESRLWVAHSATVIGLASYGIVHCWHSMGLDAMTPREFITFLGGVWAANASSYWYLWDHLKWVEPFRKFAALHDYRNLTQRWADFLKLNPELTARTAAAAATDKPVSHVRHADALADAALEALFDSNTAQANRELFEVFLASLEAGKSARAMRILNHLRQGDPIGRYTRLSQNVATIFRLRERIERKAWNRQICKASLRLLLLGLGLWGANQIVEWAAPEDIARWRKVPTAILGAIGAKRIFNLIWSPHRYATLKTEAGDAEEELRGAFRELMEIDPTGIVVSRIAKYDSGIAAHHLVTYAAADALAARPSGEVTRGLFRIVRQELARTQFAGERVSYLLKTTYGAQRTCLTQLLTLVEDTAEYFGVPQDVTVDP